MVDDNGTWLSVERRPKDVRISIGTRGGSENYFYATDDQVAELIAELTRLASTQKEKGK